MKLLKILKIKKSFHINLMYFKYHPLFLQIYFLNFNYFELFFYWAYVSNFYYMLSINIKGTTLLVKLLFEKRNYLII